MGGVMLEDGQPMGPALPERGDMVRIPKGAYIASTHPAGDRIAMKSQVVKVSHVFKYGPRGVPEVCWAGSGGYWCNSWEWEAVEPSGSNVESDG